MPFELRNVPEGVDVVLGGRLGVQQAAALWEALVPVLDAEGGIRLDAGAVEDLDTSIVQILCRLGGSTGRFRITETSDGFLKALQRRGLEKFFMASAGQPAEAVSRLEPAAVVGEPVVVIGTKAKAVRRGKRQAHG